MPPSWGAAALLHPSRRPVELRPHLPYADTEYAGDGVTLRGWSFPALGPRRGTIVQLHGSGDNRESALGVAERFTARGFDVLAYDSRAHGESSGEFCTYGYYEKRDLQRVLDSVPTRPIILIGTSLGAAVALQTAAEDERVACVVSISTFSDLRIVGQERAPALAGARDIRQAFELAERTAKFRVDDVSPARAAARINVPVLLIHGDQDDETPPAHSQRVFDALRAQKQLILVRGARHGNAANGDVWAQIERWVDGSCGLAGPP